MLDIKKRKAVIEHLVKREVKIGDLLKRGNEYIVIVGIKEYTEDERSLVILRYIGDIPTEERVFLDISNARFEEMNIEDIKGYQKTKITYEDVLVHMLIKDYMQDYFFTINETILLDKIHIGTILNIIGFEYGLVIKVDPLQWISLERDIELTYESIFNKLMNEPIQVHKLNNTYLLGTNDIKYVTDIKDKRLQGVINKLDLLGKLEVSGTI